MELKNSKRKARTSSCFGEIFKRFVIDKKSESENENRDLNYVSLKDQLILELSKPIIENKKNQRCNSSQERDIHKIEMLIKDLPDFKRLITLNNIDEKTMAAALKNMYHMRYLKGSYICREGDDSEYFFGIIRGKVCITKNKKAFIQNSNYNPFNSRSSKYLTVNKEEQLVILSEGQYFGEWGVIDDQPRKANAFALVDTDLFVLEKKSFNSTIGKCMVKTETDIKLFLKNIIKCLDTLSHKKFNEIYKTFSKKSYLKNEIVYFEGGYSSFFYIIYNGTFNLLKNKYKTNENDVHFNNHNKYTLIKLSKGDISGFELVKGEKYHYTLQADSEFSSVIEININRLDGEMINQFIESLKHYMNVKESIEKDFLNRHDKVNMEKKIIYRENIINKFAKDVKNNEYEDSKQYENIVKTINNATKREINFSNIPEIMIQKSNVNNIVSRTEKIEKKSETIKTLTNRSVLKSSLDKKSFSIVKNSRNSILNIDIDKFTFLKTCINTQSSLFSNDKLNDIKFLNTHVVPEENNAKKENNKIKSSKFQCFKLLLKKIINNPAKAKKKEKDIFIGPAKKLIEEWKIVKKSRSEFTSGCLSLPLVTQIISTDK